MGRDIPQTPFAITAKEILIERFNNSGISKRELARRAGLHQETVLFALRPDRKSDFAAIETCLMALNYQFVITDRWLGPGKT